MTNLNKKICYVFFLIIIEFFFFYQFNSVNITRLFKKKDIKLCICTLGKGENRYIKEFIEYYQKYGVDTIFLYDNNDINGESLEEPIKEYINKGFVKLFNRRGRTRYQFKILNHCYINNYKSFDWMIFYDIDEFINLKNYSNIKDFLNEKKFRNCQKIYLNWIIHTDNNLIYYDNRSLHERFPILEPNARKNNTNFYEPVKSILRGHIPNIKINCLHLLNKGLKSCNGFGKKPNLIKYTMKPDFTFYYIDHFYFKSLEEFVEKLNRGSARTHNDMKIKLFKFNRFYIINEININKLNYIGK